MDTDLINRLKGDDKGSFDELFGKYGNRIYAFGMKYLRSKEDAENLVQDVFMKVWNNRKKLDSRASFKSFLFTIAYNEICNTFRKRENLKKSVEYLSNNITYIDNNTTEAIDYNSIIDQVDKLVEQMPDMQRKVFLKSRAEGLSSKQISKELKLSTGTVDNYISSAVKYLKEKISHDNILLLLVAFLFVN